MDDDDNIDNTEAGSVWTSYSDLFTTMSIIFLVMFVFALIKSGVNTLKRTQETAKMKEYLKGKLPEEVVKETDKKKKRFVKSVKNINKYKEIINQKMLELNTLVESLGTHEQVIEELLSDQKEKEALVAHIRDELLKKDEEVENAKLLAEKTIQAKEEEVEKVKADAEETVLTQKKLADEKNQQLLALSEKLTDQKEAFEKQVNLLRQDYQERIQDNQIAHNNVIKSLKSDIQEKNVEMENIKEKISKEKKDLDNLMAQNLEVKEKLDKEKILYQQELEGLKEIVGLKEADIKRLTDEVFEKEGEVEKSRQEIQDLLSKNRVANNQQQISERVIDAAKTSIGNLLDEIEQLKKKKMAKDDEIAALQKSFDLLSGKSANAKSKIADLRAKEQELVDRFNNEKANLEKRYQNKIGDLEGRYNKAVATNNQLKGKINDLGDKINGLESENDILKKTNGMLGKDLGELRSKLGKLEGQNIGLRDRLKGLRDQLGDLNNENGKLADANAGLKNLSAKMGGDFDKYKAKLGQLEGQNKGLKDKLDRIKNNLDEAQKQADQLKALNQLLTGDNDKLKARSTICEAQRDKFGNKLENLSGQSKNCDENFEKLKNHTGKLAEEVDDLKDKLAEMEIEKEGLKGEVDKLANLNQDLLTKNDKLRSSPKLKRSPASTYKDIDAPPATPTAKLRYHIAQKLCKRLKEANIDVKIDPKTGNIIFSMDEVFLFKRNSYELSPVIKGKLSKLIPVYADELFKDDQIAAFISNINIEGHASPTYRENFVHPKIDFPEAYMHNLKLSSSRANQIVNYILAPEFKSFKYKINFRERIAAIGYSYSKPIKKIGRRLASNDPRERDCKEYDCKKSRRVEISFSLREDEDALKVLESIKEL